MEIFDGVAELWVAALSDLARMARKMWPALLQIGALYAVTVMAWSAVPQFIDTLLGMYVGRYLVLVACAFATSPFFVALHRFVATGEVRWLPSRGAYSEAAIYAAWSGVILLVQMSPILLFFVTADLTSNLGSASIVTILVVPCTWTIATRLTTLLPMAALDRRNASWSAALKQSRKRFWLFWSAVTASTLPAYFVLGVLVKFGAPFANSSAFSVLMIAGLLATQLLPLSVSTRLFRQYRADTAPTGQPPQWPKLS